MEVTDVRVRLVDNANDRLKAVCTVTLEEAFVVRDVKIVEGAHGLFVAMPSRKLSGPCPNCRTQNHLRARHCNDCGRRLPAARIPCDDQGREKAHRDVAHPITPSFRETIQNCVLEAYETERGESGLEEEVERGVEPDIEPVEDSTDAPADEQARVEAVDEEPDEEVEESVDDHKGEAVVSEYDAIIADLRGDRRPAAPRRPVQAVRTDSDSSGDERKRSRRGGRGRRQPRRSDSRGSGDAVTRRDSAPPRETETRREIESTPRPVAADTKAAERSEPVGRRPVEPQPSNEAVGAEENVEAFGAGLSTDPVTAPSPVIKRVEPAARTNHRDEPVAVEQPGAEDVGEPAVDSSDGGNDDAFGAGLL